MTNISTFPIRTIDAGEVVSSVLSAAETASEAIAVVAADRSAVEEIAERIDLGELDAAVATTAADRVQTTLDRTASQTARAGAETARAGAETARDQAQTAAASAQSSALTCATWAVLSTLTGSMVGQGG